MPEEKSKNLNDPEAGYKTEIAGGVPIKIPIKVYSYFVYKVSYLSSDSIKFEVVDVTVLCSEYESVEL